jgi:hypothetical protein
MNRSQILTVLLLVATATVAIKTFFVWRDEPWELPQPAESVTKDLPVIPVVETKESLPVQAALATKTIIDRNLFDPERGQGKRNAEDLDALAEATKRIREMVLTGTIILGETRYAILREDSKFPSPSVNPNLKTGPSTRRVKVGDTLEGFQVTQIEERKVAFTNGTTNLELSLDYFRRIEDSRVPVARALAGTPSLAAAPVRLTAPPVMLPSQNLPSGLRRTGLPPPPRP